MSSEVYKKFRHQSLMSDFDSLLSEMDGDLDATEEVEYFTSLSDLPPPDEQEELSPQYEWNEEDDLPPLYEGDEVSLRIEQEKMTVIDSHSESIDLAELPIYPEDEVNSSSLDGQDDTEFPPPFNEEDVTEDAIKYSKISQHDQSFDLNAVSHNKIKRLEMCKTDSLDFTDADNAIDRMLDDLQDFSIQLTQSIPERCDKDDLKMIPEHSTKVTHNFNLENLELSAKELEERTDVDLDALLDDLCNMEMEFTTKNNQVKSETGDSQTDINPDSETDPQSSPALSGPLADAIRDRLNSFRLEIKKSKELTEEEKTAKIKSEKIKIALEKMKAASVQKVFVRVFNNEKKTNKTFMIDSSWTARDVTNKMIAKDDVEANYNWCIMERIPNLFIERILEDSECILQTVLTWPRDSNNALVFLNRRDKYMLFRNPQNFLLSSEHSNEDAKLAEKSKDILLREYFIKDNTQIPPLESVLWLQERPRKWVKHFCVLRASGIYYNAKGKNKVRNLSCLTPFENNIVYLGVGFKKVFKAPTDHVFCLKDPKIQAAKTKGIYTLCAEDAKTKEKWVLFIRMAKHGYQMYENYIQTQEELEDIFLNAPQTDKSINDGKSIVKYDGTLNRKGTSLKRPESCVRATPTGNMNRIDGKRNALGLKFSMAWKQGLIVKAELAALANAQRKLETQSEFSKTENKTENATSAKSESPTAKVIIEDQENQSKEKKGIVQNKALTKDENENVVDLKPMNAIVKELSEDEGALEDSERVNKMELQEDDSFCRENKSSDDGVNSSNLNEIQSAITAAEDTNDLSVDDLLESLSNNLGNEDKLSSVPETERIKKEEDIHKKDTLDIPQNKISDDDSLSNFTITPLSSSSSSSSSLESLATDEDFNNSGIQSERPGMQSLVPQSVDDLLAELSCDLSDDEIHETLDTETNDFSPPESLSDNSSDDETLTSQVSSDSTTSADMSSVDVLPPEQPFDSLDGETRSIVGTIESEWPEPLFLGEHLSTEGEKQAIESSNDEILELTAAEENEKPEPAFIGEYSSTHEGKAIMETSSDFTDSKESQSVSVNEFLAELCHSPDEQKKVLVILDLDTNSVDSSDEVKVRKTLPVAGQTSVNVSSHKKETEVTVLEADKKVPHFLHLVTTLKTSNGLTTEGLMREVASNLVEKWIEASIEENRGKQINSD